MSDNGAGVSTLYDGEGVAQSLVVSVTGADGAAAPTGVVGNTGSAFVVASGGAQGPAFFIFASEDGTISGWNPNVPPPIPPATRSTTTVVAVDASPDDAVFKGITIASTASGDRLYATDFHNARVDVFDGSFAPVSTSGGFLDPNLPAGYAPFGIRAIGGTIYVTYALKEAGGDDDVSGKHHGFVNAFTPDGVLLRRVASGGKLDSPWGLAMAPDDRVRSLRRKAPRRQLRRRAHHRLHGRRGASRRATAAPISPARAAGSPSTGSGGSTSETALRRGPPTRSSSLPGPNDEEDGLFGRIDFVHGND